MIRNRKTLFCCLRIRSAGLFLGLVDLFFNLVLLLALCTALTRPSMYNYYVRQFSSSSPKENFLLNSNQDLNVESSVKYLPIINSHSSAAIDSTELTENVSNEAFMNNLNLFNNKREDRTITFLVTMGTSFITTIYIYGIIKNKSSYLLPYFCLKVFNLVITILTTLGFYSCLPNVKLWIKIHNYFPYKDELLNMDKQTLELIMFSSLLAVSLFKLYIVMLIWNCYRYIVAYNIFTLSDLLPTTAISQNPATTISTSDATTPSYYKTDDERQFQSLASASLLPPKYEEIVKTTDQKTAVISPPSYVLTQQQQQQQNEERM